ncbi:MAG: UDP-N-acetylmuramate dehydrogenase [Candidatus Omnitrophica bacterium]|nr:UDP-N-acetylmuramate dehydrogenase [Candidatus Omnitrophota bacterium]
MDWLRSLKGKTKFNESLSRHTSFKIGGKASILFEPKDAQDLVNCLQRLKRLKIPYFLIGNGTNILIKDSDFDGVVIKLSSPFFKRISIKGNILTVGPGVSLRNLIKYLSKTKLSGYEFLAGIPGSIAGALVMNAGITINSKRQSIGDITHKVKALNKRGQISNLSRKECRFNYRRSNLNKYIILQAQLKLNKDKGTRTINRIKNFLSYRNKNQDCSLPNAGCIFRNPSRYISTGKLIENCGLKGVRCGGAMISNKHANFILNFNRATANDVIKLINIVKKKVQDKFGIKLKEEIRIVP